MKILILASGKCGSSALLTAIADEYNVEAIYEPFNYDLQREVLADLQASGSTYFDYSDNTPHINFDPNSPRENIAVKCIPAYRQFPSWVHILPLKINKANMTKFFVDLTKKFDKVILLSRENKAKQLFSVMHAHKYNTWGGSYKVKPFTLEESDIEQIEDFFNIQDILNKISKHLNIEIISYEKLFNEDKEVSSKEYSKIGGGNFDYLFEKYFHPKHKFTAHGQED